MVIGIILIYILCINKTTNAIISKNDSQNCLCRVVWSLKLHKRCYTSAKSRSPFTGRTALHIAALHGITECIPDLLHSGSILESKDKDGATPLALAASRNICGTVKLLADYGANLRNLNKGLQENVKRCLKHFTKRLTLNDQENGNMLVKNPFSLSLL